MILVFLYMIPDDLPGDFDDNFSDRQSNIRRDVRILQWAATLLQVNFLKVYLVLSTYSYQLTNGVTLVLISLL